MIITENTTIRGADFVHTYSDAGFRIRQEQTGIVYDDVYDVLTAGYTYTETDEPIEDEDIYATVGRILLGEADD